MGPAGTVHLSAEDMLRYLRAHLTSDPAFLSPDAWAALHRPGAAPENYALGWIVEGSAYRHAGSNTFWLAMAWFDTDLERAAFVAVNSGDMNDVAEPVVNAAEAVLALGGE